MEIDSTLLAPWAVWLGHGLFWPALLGAAATLDPRRLARDGRIHVWCGACVGVLALWQIRAGVPPAPDLHLLGASFMALVFGARLAIIGLAGVLALTTLYGAGDWAGLGVNGTLMILAPVAASLGIARLVRRYLPDNPFVYILVTAFAGAALVMGLFGLATSGVLIAGSPLGADVVVERYLVIFALLVYAEGFVTGTLLAWLTMFYPEWVTTYRDPAAARGR